MNNRRTFLWKFGVGTSAALASTVVMANGKTDVTSTDDPILRAALLEEEKALHVFHQAFEQAMDKGQHEEVIGMFSVDAEVVFNGGVFRGRSHGVSRLLRDRFLAGKTGRRMEPAPGFELTADQQRDSVKVSADLHSATAVFPYSIQVGMPFETESSLAAMSRLHGEGVRTWWEGGVYRIDYRKEGAGEWKIHQLEYDTLSRADYRTGKSYAQPISVSPIATRFPADPHGPDDLI